MKPASGLRRRVARTASVLGIALALSTTSLAASDASGQSSAPPIGEPRLVRDLRTQEQGPNPFTSVEVFEFRTIGSRVVFFSFSTGFLECGLWSTDGTALGTLQLTDLCATAPEDDYGSAVRWLAAGAGIAYASDSAGRLWRTDGSRGGTFALGEVRVSARAGSARLSGDGRRLYLNGCTLEAGCEPWTSDGSTAGTFRLGDLVPGPADSDPHAFAECGDLAYFIATEEGGVSPALWRSDGTPAGTRRLVASPTAERILATNSALLFTNFGCGHSFCTAQVSAYDPRSGQISTLVSLAGTLWAERIAGAVWIFGYEAESAELQLWRSDGTVRGTVAARLPAGFTTTQPQLLPVGGHLLLAGAIGNADGQLWQLSGTPPRAVALDGCPGGCPTVADPLDAAFLPGKGRADRWLFAARGDRHGLEPWTTDGTAAGTRLLLDLCDGACDSTPSQFQVLRGRALWVDGEGVLWVSDGTPEETRPLVPVTQPGPYRPRPVTAVTLENRILFPGFDPVRGSQPWVSDFTQRGTRPAALLGNRAASARIWQPAAVGERIVFAACDDTGADLFASDGTAEGTLPLTGESEECNQPTVPVTAVGPLAYFAWHQQLWRTDATPTGTFPVADGFPFLRTAVALAGRLLAIGDPEPPVPATLFPLSWPFWTSDGTAGGTEVLFELPLGGSPSPLSVAGDAAFFVAQAPDSPFAETLYRTDGTANGTLPLLALGERPLDLRVLSLGADAYFLVQGEGRREIELWRSDGTADGTRPVLGFGPPQPAQEATFLSACDSTLYFFAPTAAGAAGALWSSDGTAAGTVPLAEVSPPSGQFGRLDPLLSCAGGRLFFRGEDPAHGAELWTSDGTVPGTRRLTDLIPGPAHARIRAIAAHDGRIFFAATDGRTGVELWTSDGTTEGTLRVQDIAPGPLSSSPAQFVSSERGLFFTADDGLRGRELWLLPSATDPPCQPDPRTLCLLGGRVRAEASWRKPDGAWQEATGVSLDPRSGLFSFHSLASPATVPDVAFRLLHNASGNPGAVFVGGLSNFEYSLTLTDLDTGASRRYFNPAGHIGSLPDPVGLRPIGGTASTSELTIPDRRASAKSSVPAGASLSCVATPHQLCLLNGRFKVEVFSPVFGGFVSALEGEPLSDRSAVFWLPAPRRPAIVMKIIDVQAIINRYWVFAGVLGSEELVMLITDASNHSTYPYIIPAGHPLSVASLNPPF